MYGTKETEDLLLFVAKLGNAIDNALEDGKVNLLDINQVFSPAAAAKPAFEGATEIPKELGDLDSEEAAYLVQVFGNELDLDNDVAEELTTEGLAVAAALVAYVNKLRGVRKAS